MTSAPRTRVVRRPVHGVLLLDKPLGWSSNDALQKAKWLLRAEKAGHTGTLDPLATGVLPLCFGAATKFSQLQLDADKSYEALAHMGVTTSTGDAEGQVLLQRPVQITPEKLALLAQRFCGKLLQVPPMYSALKRDGKALYEYARQGVVLEREGRSVEILELELALEPAIETYVALKLRVKCSKGTYIRTLAEDIGEALGCGAHLTALRRMRTGGFGVEECVTLAALEAMSEPQRIACLRPVESMVPDHTVVTLDAQDAARFSSGLRRRGNWPDSATVAVWGEQPRALLGVAHTKAGELIPERLLSPVEIDQILKEKS